MGVQTQGRFHPIGTKICDICIEGCCIVIDMMNNDGWIDYFLNGGKDIEAAAQTIEEVLEAIFR
jgi:hypothetical protein